MATVVSIEVDCAITEEWVSAVGELMLSVLGLEQAELSVVLGDDLLITPLNAEYRGVEEPTDVLSFPQWECEEPGVLPAEAGDEPLLGDIVISVETAKRQAAEVGHALEAELRVLLAHGLCHLLGYDHEDPEDAPAMQAAEARLLDALADQGPLLGLIARAAVE